jgi:hypothetical protein
VRACAALLLASELSRCYLPLPETSRSVSHAFTRVSYLGADPPFVLQSPNLGGGLYHNNRTGGVDSCIFAGNTVTLDFSGQVWSPAQPVVHRYGCTLVSGFDCKKCLLVVLFRL